MLARRRRGRVEYSRAMMGALDEFSDDLTFEEEDAFNTPGSYHDKRFDGSIEMAARRDHADAEDEEGGGRAFSIE